MAKVFIGIAGNIGSGKTTLVNLFADRYGWQPYYESVHDNPYLADFYVNMKRWAFHLQIHFLTRRFADHRLIMMDERSAIQDRTIYEDVEIFARNLFESGEMHRRDWESYSNLAEEISSSLTSPDLLVYLRKSTGHLLERIKMRGREYEQGIPVPYLTRLNEMYEEWIDRYHRGPLLIVEADEIDFLNDPMALEDLSRRILNSLDQRDMFLDSDNQPA